MSLARFIPPIIIIAVLAVFVSGFFVSGGNFANIPFAWIFAISATALLGYFGFNYAKIPFLNRKQHLYAGLVGVVALFLLGGFAFDLSGLMPSANVGPSGPSVTESGCRASVSDEVLGQSVTMIINAYDRESNTPLSSAVDVNPTRYYVNGDYGDTETDTSSASVSGGIGGGDVVTFYGGSSTYYLDKASECMSKLSYPIQLDAHAVVSETDLLITGFDKNDNALDSPSGTYSANQEDYEFDMGADDEDKLKLQFEVNVANKAFQLGAICIKMYEGTADTIDDVILNEAGWTETLVPNYLANAVITLNDTTQTSNTTDGYDKCYVPAAPILMSEWDYDTFEYIIQTGGTAPTEDDDATPTASTLVIVGHFDANWARGDDGVEYLDFYDHTSSEANVGLVEDLQSPLGKYSAAVIELK